MLGIDGMSKTHCILGHHQDRLCWIDRELKQYIAFTTIEVQVHECLLFFVRLLLALSRTIWAYRKLRHRYAVILLMHYPEAKERQSETCSVCTLSRMEVALDLLVPMLKFFW